MIKAEDFKWLDQVYHLFHPGSYLCLSGALTDCFLPLVNGSQLCSPWLDQILTSIKGCNSVANLPKKMTLYNPNVDLVKDNVYTKIG